MIRVAAVCGALFLIFAALVASGLTARLDLATIALFQSIASYPLDVAANVHTVIGQVIVTLGIAAALVGVVRRRLGAAAALAPAFILATGAVEAIFKWTLPHPAPPEVLSRAFQALPVLTVHAPSSFPSGHVARIAFLAVLIAAFVPGRLSGVLAAAAIVLSVFLRVYIGDHWISDALGGAALGTGVGALAIAWMRGTSGRSRPAGLREPSPSR